MIEFKKYDLTEIPDLQGSLSCFAQKFSHTCILSSNNYTDKYGEYELLAAFGAQRLINTSVDSTNSLRALSKAKDSWLFGHLSYDLKNEFEKVTSNHKVNFGFKNLSFFEPQVLFVQIRGDNKITCFLNEGVESNVVDQVFNTQLKAIDSFPKLRSRMTKEEYISSINELKQEIQYGNIYEINYCQEFYAEQVDFNPYRAYLKLVEKSKTPFAAFYKNETDYLLCASPERYLAKRGEEIISQPIKGTAKRGETIQEDELIKSELKLDLKEQTENVMIVDIVRNDLSRTAQKESVVVEELFGTYTFPQVHQLISTVKSKLKPELHFTEVIKNSFPMGSMTGAPKISAMNLAEKHEKSRRGLYSGSVGYINPKGDFDFNVVIRSLMFNAQLKYLSLSVGGAITSLAEAEKEYDECLLKAKAIFEV